MELSGWTGGTYRFLEWIYRLVCMNLLWLFFTVLGLGIFGIMPATLAMFTVIHKWNEGETDGKVFPVFRDAYLKHFKKTNFAGMLLGAIGVVIYADIIFFRSLDTNLSFVFEMVFCGLFLVWTAASLNMFVTFLHFDMKIKNHFYLSLLSVVSYPLKTVIMFFVAIGMFILMMKMPPLFLFFGGSSLVFFILKIHSSTFLVIKRNGQYQSI